MKLTDRARRVLLDAWLISKPHDLDLHHLEVAIERERAAEKREQMRERDADELKVLLEEITSE